MSRKRIVITGSAHSGKTTVIEELKNRGYPVITETAIEMINCGLNIHESAESWAQWRNNKHNEKVFQAAIIKAQLAKESLLNNSDTEIVFLDRSILDAIGYCKLRGIDWHDLLLDIKPDYSKVFFLETLEFAPRYDSGRIDTSEENNIAAKLIKESYEEQGFDVTVVPVFHKNMNKNIKQRCDFVLENIM